MGIQERRNIERIEMKKKIMSASIEIIEQEGYEKLSIRKIATKISYSPTTIYLYYKDKAEIITDMSNELYRIVVNDIVAILDGNTTLPCDQQVHCILRTFIKSLCGEQEMVKAIMYSGENVIFANDSGNSKPTNDGIAMLDKLLADGISKNIFKANAAHISWMIISALIGFVMSSIESQLHLLEDFDLHIDIFVEMLMGGIKQ